MSDALTITMDMVRDAMRSFCEGNKQVSNVQLYEILGLNTEKEKDRLRTRVNGLVNQGEVERVSPGVYLYNFKFRLRKNTTYPKIWRFVRSAKPGWHITDASLLTRVSYTQLSRYCNWLENEGYIEQSGKDGQTRLFRSTGKARQTPETPYPPMTDKNPFEAENCAAARLATLMLCHDPHSKKTAQEIVKNCNILLARFDKNLNKKPGENKYDCRKD